MEQFLNKFVYIHIVVDSKHFYYTCAEVTHVNEIHISFNDDNGSPCIYKKDDVVEIKLSNKKQ